MDLSASENNIHFHFINLISNSITHLPLFGETPFAISSVSISLSLTHSLFLSRIESTAILMSSIYPFLFFSFLSFFFFGIKKRTTERGFCHRTQHIQTRHK